MKTLLFALALALGIGPAVAAESASGSFKSQKLGMLSRARSPSRGRRCSTRLP